ncbi:MAG TPA: glycosyltransferase family 39 protein [Solirubrobacteraceae bacterium]|nr:glycosyltransferase family 39 protein [Solirubrobacteraceae bacterium]
MGLSWHNFFFGALEPGGSVSIDKPPVDLWLQVASTKALGFSTTALMLPEALGGTLAVPLLYLAVRRMWSIAAGLASALALAVLPISVITARSDTMDGVMMMLLVLALLLIVRACESGRGGWLLAGAAALGLAFDVKLLESIIALPGLALLAWLGLPGSRRRRLTQLLAASAVYVTVALAWLSATLLFPAHERPYAVGSTNGSAWNAAFVFNGLERLEGKPQPGQTIQGSEGAGAVPPSRYGHLSQAQRDHVPLPLPSATRLLDRVGPLSGARLGLMALAGLLLGAGALLCEWRRRRMAGLAAGRLRLAGIAGLLVWLLTGIVLFSHMAHLHPRYTEGFTPAVAATLGVGAAWATERRSGGRLLALAGTLVVLVIYGERLLFGAPPIWWLMCLSALAAVGLAAVWWARGEAASTVEGPGEGFQNEGPARVRARARGHPKMEATTPAEMEAARPAEMEAATTAPSGGWQAGALLALVLVCVLAIPVWASVRAVKEKVSDTNVLGQIPGPELRRLSAYLRAHQGAAYYEVAFDGATKMGALVVHDGRPILVLTTLNARLLTPPARLAALAAAGKVRYAYLSQPCTGHDASVNADCSAPARWVRAHGRDVSRQAGLRGGTLWLLPGPAAVSQPRGPDGRRRSPARR